MSNWASYHEPRSGMMRNEWSVLPLGCDGGFEGQARGTVQLADDHALGAIDDKSALRGHQRQFAHEHLFLFGALLFLEQEGHVERRAVGQAFAQALQPVHLGLADFVGMEIEHAFPIVALDGEDFGKDGLQPEVLALLGAGVSGLQKLPVGIGLQFDQIRAGR